MSAFDAVNETHQRELERLRAELERVKRESAVNDERYNDACTELTLSLNSARADNARLREAVIEARKSSDRTPQEHVDKRWADVDAALAATDSREWLREFGMKVAFALEGVPVTRERRDQIAAIVAGVMK